MQQSEVLFHPSTYESFGMVLLEAWQMGMKIVARPVGIAEAGPPFWLGDSKEELYEALKSALNDRLDFTSSSKYSLASTVDQYLKIYEEVL